MQTVTVDGETAALVRNGRVLPRWDGAGPWAVLETDGELLAVYESFRTGEAKPAVVIPTA
jgi:tRNA pseudouridine55 synthase